MGIFMSLLLAVALQQGGAADTEEQIDDTIRNSGFVAGLALQCSADAAKGAVEKTALDRASEISRLLGTDRAFFYAASYGAGAQATLNRSECAAHLKAFNGTGQ